MSLPESTHTLLITEKILSIPFAFAVGVACLSFSCLLLVLLNELSKGQNGNLLSVPGGVGPGVRGAQFCGECLFEGENEGIGFSYFDIFRVVSFQ